MSKKMTQCSRIMDYIERNGGITQQEASIHLSCARLASRVNDLRKSGVDIQTNMIAGVNQFGERYYCARYTLAKGA